MRSQFSSLSLRVTAPLVLSLPVLFAIAVLSCIAFWYARSTASQLAGDELVEIHRRIEQRLDDLLGIPARINRINAQLIEDNRLDLNDLRGWRTHLYEQAVAFEMLSGILWGSAEGETVWMFRYPGKEGYEFGIKDSSTGGDVFEYRVDGKNRMGSELTGRYEYDPRKRPWYEEAIRAGKATWTEYAWVNEDGSAVTYGLAFPQPYYDEQGKLLGVLDAELSLHDVSRFLASLEIGQNGNAFLIDRQGNLVANSVGAAVHDADLHRIPAKTSDNTLISLAAATLEEHAGSLAAIETTHKSTFVANDESHLMIVSPMNARPDLNWLTVTVVPEKDFLGEVYELRDRSLFLGIVAVVSTLLLGVILASVITRPIVHLVSHVRRIGDGHLDDQLSLDFSPEFRQLSDEINAMTEGLRDRMRMRHSLALAMDVQQSLLPTETPKIAGLDISGHSTYCDETGGDYYDFLDVAGLSQNSVAIAIGDVMGHGVAAAMLMATARGVLRSRCQKPGSLSELLNHMNQMLVVDTGGERFMTMLLMTVDMGTRELRWSSAGHDAPLIYDADRGEFIQIAAKGSLPLGLFDDRGEYDEFTFDDIRSGQIIIVSTDGLWETQNGQGEVFGHDRLRDLIRQNASVSADEINRAICASLATFRGLTSQDDDVTFVVVKIE